MHWSAVYLKPVWLVNHLRHQRPALAIPPLLRIKTRPMSGVHNIVQHFKPKPEFQDLWDVLIKQHTRELAEILKTLDVLVPPNSDVIQCVERMNAGLQARFEEIDRTYEQRFLALAQPVFFENREAMEKRMDELARMYAATHDPKVKAELEELTCGWLTR